MARGSAKPRRRLNRDEAKAKKKGCMYCKAGIDQVDYKEYENLRVVTSDKGKIRARRGSGLCRRHQAQAATAVKRSREIALLPYVSER